MDEQYHSQYHSQLTNETTLERAKRSYESESYTMHDPNRRTWRCGPRFLPDNDDTHEALQAQWAIVHRSMNDVVCGFLRPYAQCPGDVLSVFQKLYFDRHIHPLIVACRHGYDRAADNILQIADEATVRHFSYESLFAAAQNGHAHIVKVLLDRDLVSDKEYYRHLCGALQVAAARGNEAVVRLLVTWRWCGVVKKENRSPLRDRGEGECFALFAACQNGRTSVVKILLARFKETNKAIPMQIASGISLLMTASQFGHADIVNLLLCSGADPMYADPASGLYALSCAAMYEHFQIVELLYKHMANKHGAHRIAGFLNSNGGWDGNGYTPLHFACMGGYEDIVRFLVDTAKVKIHTQDRQRKTAVDHARQNGHHKIADWLKEPNQHVNLTLLVQKSSRYPAALPEDAPALNQYGFAEVRWISARTREDASRAFAEMERANEADRDRELMAARARVRGLESIIASMLRERDQQAESMREAVQSKMALCEKSSKEIDRLRMIIAELRRGDRQMKLIERIAETFISTHVQHNACTSHK